MRPRTRDVQLANANSATELSEWCYVDGSVTFCNLRREETALSSAPAALSGLGLVIELALRSRADTQIQLGERYAQQRHYGQLIGLNRRPGDIAQVFVVREDDYLTTP